MNPDVSYREIFRFYLPLVLNAQMMFLSSPFINLGLSRTTNPETAVAAFSVGFSFIAVLCSPIFTSRHISTSFVRDYASLLFVRRIFLGIGILSTASIIAIALTPLHDLIFLTLFKIPSHIAIEVRRVLLIISPVGIALSMRGVYQGIALAHKKPDILAYATLLRLSFLIITVFVSIFYLHLPGASGGAVGIMIGMVVEALFVYLQTRKYLDFTQLPVSAAKQHGPLRLRSVALFAYPLLLNLYVLTLLPSLVNGIISRSSQPELALAGFGVLYPLSRFFTSPLLGFQSTTLVLYTSRKALIKLTHAVFLISLLFCGLLAGLAFTSAGWYVLSDINALTGDLLHYTYPGLVSIFLFPLFVGIRCHSQGVLMKLQQTNAMTVSAFSKVLLILTVGIIVLWRFPGINGGLLGMGLVMLAECCDDAVMGGTAFYKTRNRQ